MWLDCASLAATAKKRKRCTTAVQAGECTMAMQTLAHRKHAVRVHQAAGATIMTHSVLLSHLPGECAHGNAQVGLRVLAELAVAAVRLREQSTGRNAVISKPSYVRNMVNATVGRSRSTHIAIGALGQAKRSASPSHRTPRKRPHRQSHQSRLLPRAW